MTEPVRTERLSLKRTIGPASELVTLDEAKAHLRVDTTADDLLIESLIQAAREYLEEASRRAFVTQTWRLNLDAWPAGDEIELPRPPLQSVTTFAYTDSDGDSSNVTATVYETDTDSQPGRIKLSYSQAWPTVTLQASNGIQITYVAGYGDNRTDVPQKWRQACLLIVGHWYENREAVLVGAGVREVPLAVNQLINLDRG